MRPLVLQQVFYIFDTRLCLPGMNCYFLPEKRTEMTSFSQEGNKFLVCFQASMFEPKSYLEEND